MTAGLLITSHKSTCTNTQSKVDQHDRNETHANDGGSPLFIIHALDIAALADLVHAPNVKEETVDEGTGSENCEGPRRGEGDGVDAEVEECGGDATEDDGELEPGQEGSLGGEVDLGLDADRDEDAWDILVGVLEDKMKRALTLSGGSLESLERALSSLQHGDSTLLGGWEGSGCRAGNNSKKTPTHGLGGLAHIILDELLSIPGAADATSFFELVGIDGLLVGVVERVVLVTSHRPGSDTLLNIQFVTVGLGEKTSLVAVLGVVAVLEAVLELRRLVVIGVLIRRH
jgi:hypothetical protein